MPIQEEAITGRPGEVTDMDLGEAGLSPRTRQLFSRWEEYNEEEQRVLQQYQAGFSAALKAQRGTMETRATGLERNLGEFARQQQKYDYYKARSRGYDTWEYEKVREAKKKYRRAREKAGEALGRAESLRAGASFEEIPWQPPEPGQAPKRGSVLFGTGLRSLASPQVAATAERPGRPPSEVGYLGLLEEERAKAGYQQRMGEVRRTALGARQTLAEQYEPIAAKHKESYLSLQERTREALALARSQKMHESHGGGYLGWEF